MLVRFSYPTDSQLRPLAALPLLVGLFSLSASVPSASPSPLSDVPPDVCSVGDSLFASSDLDGLRDLIDSVERAEGRLSPDSQVRAGLAALRVSQLTGDPDLLGAAHDYLDDAKRRYKGNACYHYYRGLVRRDLGTKGFYLFEVWARLRNRDNVEMAIREFQLAAQLRADWLAPVAAMAALSMEALEGKPGRRSRWQNWARQALDSYEEAGGTDPAAQLWRGRLLMEADSFQAALEAFTRYEQATKAGLARLERARALFALDRPREASDAYWASVRALSDSAVAAEITRDLYHIFDPRERTEWARISTPYRRARWVQRFWQKRAARDLVTETQRLAEHYARTRYARKNYRLTSEAGNLLTTDQFGSRPTTTLDDRGIVYIRMGAPDKRIPCLGSEAVYDSWVYGWSDPPTAIHFSSGRGVDDWNLLALLPGPCYERLGHVDAYYNWLAFQLSSNDPLTTLSEATQARNRTEFVVKGVLSSDRDVLPLDRQLEFGYEWLFFRGAELGTIEATLSYGVPVGRLDCKPDREAICELEARASIFGRDTVLTWADHVGQVEVEAGRGEWIFGHLRSTVEPGVWDYRVALFEPPGPDSEDELRGNRAAGKFTLPPLWGTFGSPSVSVSSLLLARPLEGDWFRGGHALALNPLHIYPPDATVDIYYEIYGIPEGESYTTEFIVLDEDDPPVAGLNPPEEWVRETLDDVRPALRLTFQESADRAGSPWIERRTTLDLTDIRPGKYTFVVAITSGDPPTTVYRLTPLRIDRSAR